jgi:hypothetical protein
MISAFAGVISPFFVSGNCFLTVFRLTSDGKDGMITAIQQRRKSPQGYEEQQ